MSDQVELTDPVDHSVGGMYGHLFRRGFHIGMSIIPFVYFEFGEKIADYLSITVVQVVSLLTLLLVFSEAIRLKLGITIFGQRDYESHQVSALAWGGFAVGLTFLILPESPELVWPLILSLSLGDPFFRRNSQKRPRAQICIHMGFNFHCSNLGCLFLPTRYSYLDGLGYGATLCCCRMAKIEMD